MCPTPMYITEHKLLVCHFIRLKILYLHRLSLLGGRIPDNRENEYLVFALWKETAGQTVVGSIV